MNSNPHSNASNPSAPNPNPHIYTLNPTTNQMRFEPTLAPDTCHQVELWGPLKAHKHAAVVWGVADHRRPPHRLRGRRHVLLLLPSCASRRCCRSGGSSSRRSRHVGGGGRGAHAGLCWGAVAVWGWLVLHYACAWGRQLGQWDT
jgi:hypothetical protein